MNNWLRIEYLSLKKQEPNKQFATIIGPENKSKICPVQVTFISVSNQNTPEVNTISNHTNCMNDTNRIVNEIRLKTNIHEKITFAPNANRIHTE